MTETQISDAATRPGIDDFLVLGRGVARVAAR